MPSSRQMMAAGTLLALLVSPSAARERAHLAALESIQSQQLLAHVEVLADDAYEGRSSGTRGGRAAASYLVERLKEMGVAGGAADGDYYQPFYGNRRNVLAQLPGSDPSVANEWIVIGAHYDHVGYGTWRTSFGPLGYIHNGADDNASGVACLLEFCEAVKVGKVRFRRPILVAFWDGEEVGLLGSKHWAQNPTVPMSDVKLAVNIDMVGRLREGRIEVAGTRTGYGLRRLASVAEDPNMWLDFTWELEANSDHWSFISRGVPTIMLHTGLHDNYHRPSDDVELLNIEGIRTVSRYLFDVMAAASAQDQLPRFRRQARQENPAVQSRLERPLPPLPPTAPTPRVGISWREDAAEPGAVFLTRVAPESPAAEAGLAVHDRVLQLGGESFNDTADFETRLRAELTTSAEQLVLLVERRGRVEPVIIELN